MAEQRRFGSADIMMVTTCFLWGLGTVICKNAIGTTPESFRISIFNGLRFPIATALLFITVKVSGKSARISRKHLPGIALVSFFGMFTFNVLFFSGLSMTTASNAGIILAIIPLVIVVMSFLLRIEKPTKWLITGIIMGCAGVVFMNWQNGGILVHKGDMLILASSICWAVYAIFGEKYMHLYSPYTATAWIFLFTSLFYVPIVLYSFPSQSWADISGGNWFNFGFAAVGPLFIANTLYYASIYKIGPSRSGIYINLEPVFTLLLAFVIRHETITPHQIIGLMIIIIGVSVSKIRGPKSASPVCIPHEKGN